MKILLTNDDGINARGIRTLAAELAGIAKIYMAAPEHQQSATGHSITVFQPIITKQLKIDGVEQAWMIKGTPADCVKLAIARLIREDIDLVVSGINHGSNLGTDVFYSGTVSAAAEGVVLGVPAIAVSLNSFAQDADFNFAARFTKKLIKTTMRYGMEPSTLINLNIPAILPQDIKGVRITKLGVRNYDNLFEERQDPHGNNYYWIGGGIREEEQEEDSDVLAAQRGYISVTPIHLDLTDYNLIGKYQVLFKKYLTFNGDKHAGNKLSD